MTIPGVAGDVRDACIVAGAPDGVMQPPVLIHGLPVDRLPEIAPAPGGPTTIPAGPTDAPMAAWAGDLASQLECTGPIPAIGGEVGSLGPWDGATTPEAALQSLLDAGVFASFPAAGFQTEEHDGDLVRHAYRVNGRLKAVAVTSDAVPGIGDGLWHVIGIRACDASEFDPVDGLTFPTILWRDADGHVVSSARIHAIPGPAHCGWGSAVFLSYLGAQYLRDPAGILADQVLTPFAPHATLPPDAVDSGLNTAAWRLFTTRSGNAVYIKLADGTFERWGRTRGEIGCA